METSPATTQMTAPESPKKAKLVKIRTISACMLSKDVVTEPGNVVEVDEATAKEFCDRRFDSNYAFGGERSVATADKHVHTRAVRVG